MRKKTCTLARVWRQRCSCCHNCSEHNNRNCPVSGKIMPAEVAGSTLDLVCQWRQWAWFRCQQASSNFRLTASPLKWPFVSAANATSERTISQCEHRKRYGTFALRNAWQDDATNWRPTNSHIPWNFTNWLMCLQHTFLTEQEVTNKITFSAVYTVCGLLLPEHLVTWNGVLSFKQPPKTLLIPTSTWKFSQQLLCSVSFKQIRTYSLRYWTACIET